MTSPRRLVKFIFTIFFKVPLVIAFLIKAVILLFNNFKNNMIDEKKNIKMWIKCESEWFCYSGICFTTKIYLYYILWFPSQTVTEDHCLCVYLHYISLFFLNPFCETYTRIAKPLLNIILVSHCRSHKLSNILSRFLLKNMWFAALSKIG